jgi:hypothetical protein
VEPNSCPPAEVTEGGAAAVRVTSAGWATAADGASTARASPSAPSHVNALAAIACGLPRADLRKSNYYLCVDRSLSHANPSARTSNEARRPDIAEIVFTSMSLQGFVL